jgi:hypothetical protein
MLKYLVSNVIYLELNSLWLLNLSRVATWFMNFENNFLSLNLLSDVPHFTRLVKQCTAAAGLFLDHTDHYGAPLNKFSD